MNIIDALFDKAGDFIRRRKEEKMLQKFGGIQRCPWCRQWAQSEDGWSFRQQDILSPHDILTCGVCGGTSLWHFAVGMHYVCPMNPPKPADWEPSIKEIENVE